MLRVRYTRDSPRENGQCIFLPLWVYRLSECTLLVSIPRHFNAYLTRVSQCAGYPSDQMDGYSHFDREKSFW
jgi:hypothetical protein